ncbi:MAG TPA: SpoIIE family protein phosphatase [Phycisphaerae bacterium]
MRILVHQGDELLRDERFPRIPILIGSASNCTIRIPDQRVADMQIKIFPHAGEAWLIEPLALGHRTVRNGHVLVESTYVEQGDEIDVGDYSLRLYPDPEDFGLDARAVGTTPAFRQQQTYEEVARIRSHPVPAGSDVRRGDEPVTLAADDQQALARLAFALHSATDIGRLFENILTYVLRRLDARFAWMGLRRRGYGPLESVEGRSSSGPSSAQPPMLETLTYRCIERSQFLLIPRPDANLVSEIGSILAVPILSRRGVLGLIYVDSVPGMALGTSEIDILTVVASLTAVHLEGIIEKQIRLQEAVEAGELSFIRQVQARLDPTNVPQWDGYQLAVYCRHGRQQAGDVYDVIKLPKGLIALIAAHADASTTRAALAITEVRAAFRVAGLHADAPHIVMRELNWLLHDPRDPCALACAAIVINPANGAFQYCTGGPIGAVVIDSDGQSRNLSRPDVPAVGINSGQTFGSEMGRIMPGETLALFTGGCYTIQNAAGQPLGQERFLDALCDGFGQTASAAMDGIQMELSDYFSSGRQPDDITILLLHREQAL